MALGTHDGVDVVLLGKHDARDRAGASERGQWESRPMRADIQS